MSSASTSSLIDADSDGRWRNERRKERIDDADLHEAEPDDGRFGVVAVAEAVHEAGAAGHNILPKVET